MHLPTYLLSEVAKKLYIEGFLAQDILNCIEGFDRGISETKIQSYKTIIEKRRSSTFKISFWKGEVLHWKMSIQDDRNC